MKKKLQGIIDTNKGNIGFVGTDSNYKIVITDKNNHIIYEDYWKDHIVDIHNGKIIVYKDEN